MRLTLLPIDQYIETHKLEEIKRLRVFRPNGTLDDEGLHSPKIYNTEDDKKYKVCYYNLGVEYVHPIFVRVAKRRSQLLYDGLMEYQPVAIEKDTLVKKDDGLVGVPLMKEILKYKGKISIHPLIDSILLNSEPSAFISTKVLIVPPVFRMYSLLPSVGVTLDELDLMYMELGAVKRTPQLPVLLERIVDYIVTKMKGKEGVFRSQFLVRRKDFSSRLVITVDPTLPVDEVKVPYRVLALLFAPHVVHLLLHPTKEIREFVLQHKIKLPQSSKDAYTMLKEYYRQLLPRSMEELFSKIIDVATKDKVVIAKRDPVLHRGSVFAFYPRGYRTALQDVYTMAISPLVTTPLNADFDGDSVCTDVTLRVVHPDGTNKVIFTELSDLQNLVV